MSEALTRLDFPNLSPVRSGKVREVYDAGEHYLLVATDRISAFDCVLPTGIPDKGRVLNSLSAWWFQKLQHLTPHHVVSVNVDDFPASFAAYRDVLKDRSMLVKKTKVFPVECVARGHLIGSGWKEYTATGEVCGIPLRPGYRLAERLDEPIFTPSTKAESGHDENITFAQLCDRIGKREAIDLRDLTLRLYGEAMVHAARRGIILADTKFEFGLDDRGTIIWIDEALTPDSSRYWPVARYLPGDSPTSFDKQFVRDYLEGLPWNKQPPAPALPPEVIEKTREKYLEVFHLLTGRRLHG
ncbi:MAG TPA: phosphoribosylaminoimidazolesuccinocarboxamide synthase [Kiritimatiellia bacterium]|nr:phosphoribosylaminoimidazolesuccinocarboxamide synthase [Kiritimatiellia bacterium]HMO99250.1 phosphoribosylaminoimidazolesuccinocarboxamide synthase [Kiritimatiellia bacterium]HMP96958.1 phosphoribosylaminoimidazolesuccinocarboxamide synthase [Kiritimatiellia bacterium]